MYTELQKPGLCDRRRERAVVQSDSGEVGKGPCDSQPWAGIVLFAECCRATKVGFMGKREGIRKEIGKTFHG
jgi:hypothetical protein